MAVQQPTSFCVFSLLGSSSLGQSLKVKGEEFRRRITNLDKDHAKDFKKVHHSIKRKLDFLRKLERKSGKETAPGLRKEPVSVAGEERVIFIGFSILFLYLTLAHKKNTNIM